jgi:hypothetical protein
MLDVFVIVVAIQMCNKCCMHVFFWLLSSALQLVKQEEVQLCFLALCEAATTLERNGVRVVHRVYTWCQISVFTSLISATQMYLRYVVLVSWRCG